MLGLLGGRVAVTHRWAGIFGARARLPAGRRAGPGAREAVWVAGGYSGHGNVLGPDAASSSRGDPRGSRIPLFDRVSTPGRLLHPEPGARRLARRAARGRPSRSRDPGSRARSSRRRWPPPSPRARRLRRETSPSWVTSLARAPASTAWTRSPLWLACSQSSQKTRTRASSPTAISAFPGPVRAHQARVLPGAERAFLDDELAPGVTVTRRSASSASSRLAGAARRARAAAARARSGSTSQSRTSRPAGDERPRRRPPVHAGADHGGRGGARPAERLGGEHGRAGSHAVTAAASRTALEGRRTASERRTRPGHGREAPRRVARERRHPLEQSVPGAERGHGAEVAVRVGGHVDLRRHRPLAAA